MTDNIDYMSNTDHSEAMTSCITPYNGGLEHVTNGLVRCSSDT